MTIEKLADNTGCIEVVKAQVVAECVAYPLRPTYTQSREMSVIERLTSFEVGVNHPHVKGERPPG